MSLFHREIYLPEKILALSNFTIHLSPTRHAIEAAQNDRYGQLNIPKTITFSGKNVIEAEVENGKLEKLVVRLPYDARRDAIYVFLTDGTLKTAWFNLITDIHSTLKRHLYTPAPK